MARKCVWTNSGCSPKRKFGSKWVSVGRKIQYSLKSFLVYFKLWVTVGHRRISSSSSIRLAGRRSDSVSKWVMACFTNTQIKLYTAALHLISSFFFRSLLSQLPYGCSRPAVRTNMENRRKKAMFGVRRYFIQFDSFCMFGL